MTEIKIDKKYYLGKDILDAILAHMDTVAALPAADVVEVVRCQDCKYLGIKDFVYGYCENQCGLHGIVRPESYCSRGERKEVQGGTGITDADKIKD